MKYYKLVEMDKCPSEAWIEAKESLASLAKHVCDIVKEEQKKMKEKCGQLVYADMTVPVQDGDWDGNIMILDNCILIKPNGVLISDGIYVDNFSVKKHINCTLSFLNQVIRVLSEMTAEQIRHHLEERLAD
jgi:hypothetical protein